MKLLRRLLARLAGILPNPHREADLSAELEAHLQLATEDHLRTGLSPVEARRRALLDLGGLEPTRQAYRTAATLPWLEDLLHDLRFAFRQLRKNLVFTLTVILMLALGTAASVAIFSFVDAALIKPLPYTEPKTLLAVFESIPLGPHFNLSYPDYLDWKRANTTLASLDVYSRGYKLMPLPSGGNTYNPGARVSDGFFRTLGVAPALGRDFQPGEDLPSAPRTVILSDAAWRRNYSANPNVIGQSVTLDGQPNTIIGVLPSSFQFAPLGSPGFFTTLQATNSCDLRRSCHSLFGIARLKPGITAAAAQANLIAVAATLEARYPQDNRGQSASALPLTDYIFGDLRPTLLVLLAGAALLLLIAITNVASLLLLRSEGRRREIALRAALGATCTRIARQFLTEALLLVLTGTALGLTLASQAIHLLLHLIPRTMLAEMPFLTGLTLTPHALFLALAIATLTATLLTLTPILRTVTTKGSLAQEGRPAGLSWRRLGSPLVVLELATAVVLLVCAGLLGKSFYRLTHVELGFHPGHLATIGLNTPSARYPTPEGPALFAHNLLANLATLPGVQSAAISSGLPIGGSGGTEWVRVLGRPWHGEHLEMAYLEVTPTYFSTLGATLARGRFFSDTDTAATPHVAIVNQAFARTHFPNEDPIGHQLAHTSTPNEPPMQIVGIVDDLREGSLDHPIEPVLYLPFAQSPEPYFSLIVRTAEPEQSQLVPLTHALARFNSSIVTGGIDTIAARIDTDPSAYLHRSTTTLVGAFAALALLLAIVGLYGVIAYSVSQRTREIGVRMALGAQRATVVALILREAARLTLSGIAAGLLAAIAAATLIRKLLFQTQAWDIPTLLAVAAVLGLAALLASFLPAHRAASINPVDALRAE